MFSTLYNEIQLGCVWWGTVSLTLLKLFWKKNELNFTETNFETSLTSFFLYYFFHFYPPKQHKEMHRFFSWKWDMNDVNIHFLLQYVLRLIFSRLEG